MQTFIIISKEIKGDGHMEIFKETFFMQGLLAAAVIGIVAKIAVLQSYRKLLQASKDMDKPKRHWMGVLKKKFESYYQLEANVHNSTCIVDKYFESHTILGINAGFWEQIPGFCGILCILLGCIGSIRGILAGDDFFVWMQSLMVSAVFGLGIFMMDYLFHPDHMKRMIRINLTHFIENVLPNRMDKSEAKKEKEKKQQIKQQEHREKEKESADRISNHWEQIAASKELELTQEDIQTLKDFINDL